MAGRYYAKRQGAAWIVKSEAGALVYETRGLTRTTTPQSRALRMAADLNKDSTHG